MTCGLCHRITARMVLAEIDSEDEGGREGEGGGGEIESGSGGNEKKETRYVRMYVCMYVCILFLNPHHPLPFLPPTLTILIALD